MEQLTLDFQDSPSTKEAASPYVGTKSRAEVGTSDLIAGILGDALNDRTAQHLDSLNLATLPDLSRHDLLAACPAFGAAEFERVMDAVELGRRVADRRSVAPLPRLSISSTTIALSYCREHFARLVSDAKQEELHVLTLDTKNHVIDSHRITIGTLDASLVHPREVFRPAITDAAASIIIVHNHPSGDPTPSKEDHKVTQRLTDVGKTLGIDLLDHIVVAKDGAVSIREHRILG